MTIEALLEGHTPTETWLATDDAARILSDAATRTRLYASMHPCAEPSHAPLLRALLAHEVAFRSDAANDDDDRFENLYWCALLLSQCAELRDVLALWRAKQTNFDTGANFDVQFLVLSGVKETLAYLAQSNDPDASKAASYIAACSDAGNFEGMDEWLEGRRVYFDPELSHALS